MAKTGFDNITAEVESNQQQKTNVKYVYFKVTDKPKQLRFLTLDGENSVIFYHEHFTEFKNGWKRSTSCPDYNNTGDKKCLLCLSRKGKDEDILKDNCGPKIAMQVIERGDEGTEDKLKVFKFSPFLWNKIVAFFKQYGDLGDRDYTLEMHKETDASNKSTVNYEMYPVSKRAIPLSDEDLALAEKRASLFDVEPRYDEDQIRKIMSRDKPGGDMQVSRASVDDTLAKFLGAGASKPAADDDDDDVVIAKKPIAVPAADEEDDDDEAEFFNSLKAKKK
jgi:hypothetical protein